MRVRKTKILGAVTLLFSATTLAACGSSVPEVPAADTVELEPKDVVSRVSASATIDSREVVALTTALTGPVTAIDVRVGQPVQEGQVLARVDTSSVQRELDTQRAQQMVSEATSQSQLQAAQQELNQKQEAMNRGLNPQIAQAQAAQRDADAALSEARTHPSSSARLRWMRAWMRGCFNRATLLTRLAATSP